MTGAQVPAGRLIVCPTPIGNLGDITLRALERLREADVVACEDTRRTRVLLDRFQIGGKLISFHEHNERQRAPDLLERIAAGEAVALVSDAGTPLLSDPGHALIAGCVEAGLPIEVLPGPSAVLVALLASGLPSDRFCFLGFLPRKRSELERVLRHDGHTLVAFESPRRLAATLSLLAEREPERRLAVCRELTKLHEEVRRGSAAQLAAHYGEGEIKGEIVLVIAASRRVAPHDSAAQAVRQLVQAGARPRSAASVVSSLTEVPVNELYRAITGS